MALADSSAPPTRARSRAQRLASVLTRCSATSLRTATARRRDLRRPVRRARSVARLGGGGVQEPRSRPLRARSRSASRRTAAGRSRRRADADLGGRRHRGEVADRPADAGRRTAKRTWSRTPARDTLMTIDATARTPIVSGLGARRRLPRAARPVRRGRHGAGLLELANVPYVGAGVLASAVGMDKAVMKLVFAAKGLPICDYEVVLKREWQRDERSVLQRVVNRLGFPVFVKPANLGSSVGISKAKHAAELRTAISSPPSSTARSSSRRRCRTRARSSAPCSATTSPRRRCPARSSRRGEFYDYEAKYLDGGSRDVIPRRLPRAAAIEIRTLAVARSRRSTAPAWRASISCSPATAACCTSTR